MIELYLAIVLFGVGTYFGRNTKRPVLKQMQAVQDASLEDASENNANNVKKPKNLIVYSKTNDKTISDIEKEYGKQLDSKCREILPRDFNGLLDKKSQKEYEGRKLSEASLNKDLDNEILKYSPKNENNIRSKLTGVDIPIQNFTNSRTVGKDGNTEDTNMNNWAMPFFGGKATQSMKSETFQNKLETFTGTGRFNYHKKEIKPLFVPNKNVSFVNGTPIYNEGARDRFISSNFRNTELPFEQKRVARGVGQNYGSSGVGGFHQYETQEVARQAAKTVDQLRALSNPKTTYKQPVLSGKGISGRSANVNVKKYRPDKFYTQSPSRYLRTTGAFLKNKSPERFIVKNTGRSISRQIVGSAAPGSSSKPYRTPNFRGSTRNNYINSGLRNLFTSGGWDESGELSDYGRRGIRLAPNERDVTQRRSHTLNLVDAVKAIIAPLQDKMKKTKKENIIGNPNPDGYVSVNVPNKQTIYDPNDIAKTTIKETTLHDTGDQNITGIKKQTIYDPNDIARTTIKETTIYEDVEKAVKGPTKLTVYDPNDVAKTTIKETTLFESGDGNLRETRPEKSPNYDIKPLKNTIKETTIDNIHHTNISYSNGDGYGYLSTEFDAPATMKQFTSDVEYGGNVSSSLNNKGGYLSNEYDAPATLKQFTSDHEYTGSANSANKASQDYGSSKNMITNASKEAIAKGRTFTQHGTKVYNGEDYMNVLYKKQNANIDYENKQNISRVNQSIVGTETTSRPTSQRVPLANIPDIERTNPRTLDQLDANPFAISINRSRNTNEQFVGNNETDTEYTDEEFI
jgi:hypothetical protein